MSFDSFYLYTSTKSISNAQSGADEQGRQRSRQPRRNDNRKGQGHDRTQTLQQTRRRRPRLAEGQASLLVRQLLRPRENGAWQPARMKRRRDRTRQRES